MTKRSFSFFLVAFMALAGFFPAHATNQLTIYDGNDYSNISPINLTYFDEVGTRTQVIFPADVLVEMIDEPINSMTFYVADQGITINGGQVRVSVTETTQIGFYDGYIEEGLTQVATISMTAGMNRVDIEFDHPFIYHGNNLVLDTYIEEVADNYSFDLFVGYRPDNYATMTRGEVSRFIPKTTFNYGTDDEYAAKVLPAEVAFNTTRVGNEDVQTIVLKNIGQNAFSPSFETEAPFGVISPNAVLAPGQSVEVPVTFSPLAEGPYSGILTINYGPSGILSVPLNGIAAQAVDELVVCDSTDYASYVPIYGADIDVVNTEGQIIYPAEMLTDMVGRQILGLRFHVYENVEMNGGTIQLSLKIVEQNKFTSEALMTDLTAVATVSPEYGSTDFAFDFEEPYEYNGGNLLVDCKVIEAGVSNYRQTFFYGTPMEYNCGVYRSCWYGNHFETEYVPFLPMITFSYSKEKLPYRPTLSLRIGIGSVEVRLTTSQLAVSFPLGPPALRDSRPRGKNVF